MIFIEQREGSPRRAQAPDLWGSKAPRIWLPRSPQDDVLRVGTWDMGLGLNQTIGSVMGGAPPFFPTDIAGWYYFIDPDRYTSLTPGATLKASGTASPPVVTLSGTKASRGALRIECTSSTQFKWGYDNDGTTATSIQTGQTIPAGGSPFSLGSTGLSATFPAGTYANGHIYEETVTAIVDQANVLNSFTQATASKQPRLLKSINGKYCLRFDGVDDSMFNAAPTYPPQAFGAILWLWGVGIVHSTTSFNRMLSGNSALFIESGSSTTMRMVAGANGNAITFTPGTAARWIVKFSGTALADSFKWGSAAAVTGTNAGASGSTAGIWIGSYGASAGTYTDCTLGAHGSSTTEATGANLTNLEAWGIAAYGAGLF